MLEAVLLGIVQGIAEFLPISSSGHLVIAGELIRLATGDTYDPEANVRMNIVLHVGTLFSIIAVYHADLRRSLASPRTCGLLIVATLPVVVVALVAGDLLDRIFTPFVAGCGLLLTATLLLTGRRLERERHDLSDVGWTTALVVGLFQAVAVVPGVSRSGSTITGGLVRGLTRRDATTLSFLVAVPAIAGAACKELLDSRDQLAGGGINWLPLALGGLTAFIVGMLALRALIAVVASQRLHWFAYYCLTVGAATIVWQLSVIGGR